MSCAISGGALRVELRSPRVLFPASMAILLLAVGTLLSLPLGPAPSGSAALAVLIAGGWRLYRWETRRPSAIRVESDGRVVLSYGEEKHHVARLAGRARVLSTWVAMPLDRPTPAGRALLVTPDMTGGRDFRRLARSLRAMNPV